MGVTLRYFPSTEIKPKVSAQIFIICLRDGLCPLCSVGSPPSWDPQPWEVVPWAAAAGTLNICKGLWGWAVVLTTERTKTGTPSSALAFPTWLLKQIDKGEEEEGIRNSNRFNWGFLICFELWSALPGDCLSWEPPSVVHIAFPFKGQASKNSFCLWFCPIPREHKQPAEASDRLLALVYVPAKQIRPYRSWARHHHSPGRALGPWNPSLTCWAKSDLSALSPASAGKWVCWAKATYLAHLQPNF